MADEHTASLQSLSQIAGCAVALGAERVAGVSEVERFMYRKPVSRSVVREIRERIRAGEDPLGDALCALQSTVGKRASGAFFTPRKIVEAMIALSEDGEPPARVIDPGAGSGRFAVKAAERFPDAHIVAVELDPRAALIARANIAAAGLARRAEVRVRDYRSYTPPPIDGPTLYIGNPPYVRHHGISADWKRWLMDTATARGLSATALAGLHVHFFLAIAATASPGDRGTLITSSEWLDVGYGRLLRELMLDGLGGTAVHVISPHVRPFENAHVTGAVTCFRVGARPNSLRLRSVGSIATLARQAGMRVSRERLSSAERWTPLLRRAPAAQRDRIQLGELFRVHRGAATGANHIWIVDPGYGELPQRFLHPVVTRASELFAAGEALQSTDGLRLLVELPARLEGLDAEALTAVKRFLRTARAANAHTTHLASHRNPWWSVGSREPPPILVTYMARRPPAVIRNLAGARYLNIAHGLYPREPLSNGVLDAVASALHRSIDLAGGRTYAGGLTKFEPKELERIELPKLCT